MSLIDRNKFRNETFQQAIKYLFVGGICTALDFLVLFLLVELCHINYIIASVFSFICGVILNYFICTYWIFKVRFIKKKKYEFLVYIAVSIVGLGINTFCIWGLTNFFHFYFMISKLLSSVVTYFWNFCIRKYFLHSN